ncbi:MAG TPA: TIGR04211 family SH3 domain-containing protein [Gammaproteobacteria bacterium]|nr:TIGR04211 family SH3 domain-containing protein [Gammaproteobacteria bacterium]
MRLSWVGLVALALELLAHGQTRYVTDRTIVELRRGPSTEYLILRNLEAGERVEVLEQNGQGYSRVRVADQGTEGWILTRFLIDEPIARERLAAAERNLTGARERASTLEAQNQELARDLATARTELEQARTGHATVSRELADLRTAAANVVEIRDDNTRLTQSLGQRERQVEHLTADNARLAARNNQNWFVVGAAVLLAGIVIGLVAPTLRRKRRSDW